VSFAADIVVEPPIRATLLLALEPKQRALKRTGRKAKRMRKGQGTQQERTKCYALHIISDATGRLAQHLVDATLTQFPNLRVDCKFHSFCDTAAKVQAAIKALKRRNAIVLHAIVDPEGKKMVHETCEKKKIPHFDLTGSLTHFIGDHTESQPSHDLFRLHRTDEHYFQRIDALEFTLQHDDSQRLKSLTEATIVLVGVSRVSKTPTSIFLGSLGYKTANVSIAGQHFPKELAHCKKHTVALTMMPKQVHAIRTRRFRINRFAEKLEAMGAVDIGYLDLRDVIHEVSAAEAEYRRRGYPIIDITEMTVEETAVHVLDALNIKRGHFVRAKL